MGRTIQPGKALRGKAALPGDKSVSHRAIMAGALAKGVTRIDNILDCDDVRYTAQAFRDMGLRVAAGRSGAMTVSGRGLTGLKRPEKPLSLGSSGTTMRLLAGILAGQPFDSVLTGDRGLLKRPMRRVVEPLKRMGLEIRSEDNEHPPLYIRGGVPIAATHVITVPSAQVKSAILFAGLYAHGVTVVKERFPSRDHTERILRYFGADIRVRGNITALRGGKELSARRVTVPADISSAAFIIVAAALLPSSEVVIPGVLINPTRAGILGILKRMGVRMTVARKAGGYEPVGDIRVRSSATKGVTIAAREIPSLIDEIPILAVLAARSRGKTVINGIGELRVKETDRVASIVSNLSAMGARVSVEADRMVIDGSRARLRGAALKSYGDHRTAMAMTVAALTAKTESTLDDAGCVTKSFPQFFDVLESLVAA